MKHPHIKLPIDPEYIDQLASLLADSFQGMTEGKASQLLEEAAPGLTREQLYVQAPQILAGTPEP